MRLVAKGITLLALFLTFWVVLLRILLWWYRVEVPEMPALKLPNTPGFCFWLFASLAGAYVLTSLAEESMQRRR